VHNVDAPSPDVLAFARTSTSPRTRGEVKKGP